MPTEGILIRAPTQIASAPNSRTPRLWLKLKPIHARHISVPPSDSLRAELAIACATEGSTGTSRRGLRGTRERISLRPPDPHSPWHDAISQQSGRFTGDPEATELLPVCRRLGSQPTSRLLKERILPLSVFACASSPPSQEQITAVKYIVDSVHHFDGR